MGGTRFNVGFILNEKRCDLWETRNVPDHEILGNTDREQKLDLAHRFGDLAEQGRGSRHSYRVILSFEQKITSEKALTMAREFLDKSHFRDHPAILAVHQDTNHTHLHITALARSIFGKKLALKLDQYKSFSKTWRDIYAREFSFRENESSGEI